MLNKHNGAVKRGRERQENFKLHCFMCGRTLGKHEQVISVKGWRCGPTPGYTHIMWVHEECAEDLKSLLRIDIKKLASLRLFEAQQLAEKERDNKHES